MKTYQKVFPLNVLEVRSIPQKKGKSIASALSSLSATFTYLGKAFLEGLTAEPELRVWHETDRQGNTWWYAYDPLTRRSTRQASEDDLRIWIEQRYYQ